MHENAYEYMHTDSQSNIRNNIHTQQKTTAKRTKIATFNVRGLTKLTKQRDLANDMSRYHIDVCCLQETKVSEFSDEVVDDVRIVLLPGKECRHYGLGFAMNKDWANRLQHIDDVSDRVASATFKLSDNTTMTVINVYGPTQKRADDDKSISIRDEFYDQLEATLNKVSKRAALFIVGDFNSKIGQDWMETRCIGRYCRGIRNSNGQQLVEFSEARDLFATNTKFQHRACHRTTWKGERESRRIFNQIDYIFVPRKQLYLVTNSRSYSGTKTESDHRLVVATTRIKHPYAGQKQTSKQVKYNLHLLATSTEAREDYRITLEQKIADNTNSSTAFEKWAALRMSMAAAAKETIGTVTRKRKTPECPVIAQLSVQQHQLRIEVDNAACVTKRKQLKACRNKLLDEIRKRINTNENNEIERRTEEINKLKDGARMFKAVKELTSHKPKKLVIKNDSDEIVAEPTEAAEIVAKHFHSLFFNQSISSLSNLSNSPTNKSLNSPITTIEVQLATAKLRNGRAIGPDGIPGELLKYGNAHLHTHMAAIYNEMFENGEDLELGRGTLVVLPKPGKPPGLLSSLRPIVLLTTLRKTLSLIALQRIRPAVERFLPASQSGFRQNRSTADVVWMHKWLIARVMVARELIEVLGLDMSRAFDTLDRQMLLDELHAIIDEDSCRMVHILLDKTTLQAKIGRALSEPFETNLGAPQGDSLSPVLFIIYLELAMRQLRAACPRPPRDLALPAEAIYADDTDFISSSTEVIAQIEPQAKVSLGEWNLSVNTDKTEHTLLRRETEKEKETWRSTKKLGTLLGDREEMKRRKQLAAVSFNNLTRIWSRKNNKISTERKLRLYDAYVTPVLTYNACTWALTEVELAELEACRRRHLRRIIGVYYPRRISNNDLYRKCNMTPLEPTIRNARWRMLGHTLRMADDIPAKQATLHYFDNNPHKFLGRPRQTLPHTINNDLKRAALQPEDHPVHALGLPKQLKAIGELRALEAIAVIRPQWQHVVTCITNTQVPEPRETIQRCLRPRGDAKRQ
jgi:exonuclease III